jgi:hypothetical protein
MRKEDSCQLPVRSGRWCLLAALSLLLVLTSCGVHASSQNTSADQTTLPVVEPMHVTEPLTSCPPNGVARNAILPPLPAQGSGPSIVYVVNDGPDTNPIAGKLERYDVRSGQTSEIITLPNASIESAEVSPDGQWVLMSGYVGLRAIIMLVRLDGQDLQTLYCARILGSDAYGSVGTPLWSPDGRWIAFDGGISHSEFVLLEVASGRLLPELPWLQGDTNYFPFAWLDSTHLYVSNLPVNGPPYALYLLDTGRGANQHLNDVRQAYQLPAGSTQGDLAASCWDADPSADASALFVAQCKSYSDFSSQIVRQPAAGGIATVIFSSTTLHIEDIRAASPTTLLLDILWPNGPNGQNGLWKINSDGTGLAQLLHPPDQTSSFLNVFSHTRWGSVSRDGSLYALETSTEADPHIWTLLYGSLAGGALTTFATSSTGRAFLAGWTTT